jgi:8-oxo-dGTP pyrophosphatase MutT (NUDIX family)
MVPPIETSMDREELRRRLRVAAADPPPGWPNTLEHHLLRPLPDSGPLAAAVLLGLVARPGGPRIILTQRTDHLANHAAEISLPGGRIEPQDEGPWAAARREAFEEIGLLPEQVECLGLLPPYDTVTGFRIHPLVGWIEPPVTLSPNPLEVAEVFEVPLGFVLDPANQQQDSILIEGCRHHFYVLPYPGRRIWGATAGILVNFARLLAG